jgi:choline dehydrogenase
MSAHMAAPLYGIAERAYDLIVSTPIAKGGAVADTSPSTSTSTSTGTTKTGTSTSSSADSASTDGTSGASSLVGHGAGLASSAFAVLLAFLI